MIIACMMMFSCLALVVFLPLQRQQGERDPDVSCDTAAAPPNRAAER